MDKSVWFANEGQISLVQVSPEGTIEYKIGTEEDTDLCKVASDSQGNFYISSSYGVFSISAESIRDKTFQKKVLDINVFEGQKPLIVDKTDNIWVRHPALGVSKFSPFQQKMDTYFKGESLYRIIPNQSGSQILISKTDFGIWENREVFIPLKWEVPHFHSVYYQSDRDIIWSVQREEGNLTESILVRENYVTKSRIERDFDQEVLYKHPFLEDEENLWVALNSGGLGLINQENLSVSPYYYSDPNQMMRKETETIFLYQDVNGDIYQCMNDGLLKIKLNDKGLPVEYKLFRNDPNDENTLSGNQVSCAEDDPLNPDSIIWIGTKGNGMNKLNKITGHCTRYSMENGLPDDVIYGILADDDGHLWLSSNRGVSRFSPSTEEVLSFTEADGLQSTEFNTGSFAKLPSGELAFGGVEGLNIFHPKDIRLNDFSPPIVLSSLKVNNENLELSREESANQSDQKLSLSQPLTFLEDLELDYNQNLIAIEYSSMDFTNPEKNNYKYILEGRDDEWNEVGNIRLALYSNLNPGNYIFKVTGTNSEGIWSDDIRELRITIHPPWWRSKVAYACLFLLLASGIFGLYFFQLNRAKLKTQLAYEIKEAERLAELDKLKTDFFSNITHEFRTPLTLILEPVRQLLKEPLGAQARNKLKLIKGNSDRLLSLVNQLLDISKLEGKSMPLNLSLHNISEIIQPIYEAFLPLSEKKEVQLNWNPNEEIKPSYWDKGKLEKVLFNLLSNAMKFTEKGDVSIVLKKEVDSQISIKIKDTGIGISADQLTKVFDRFYQVQSGTTRMKEGTGIGLALSKELTELMGGSLRVESVLDQGTTFTLILPVVKNLTSEQRTSSLVISDFEEELSIPFVENDIVPVENNREEEKKDLPILLLVEDNREVRQFVKTLLKPHFTTIEASDGEQGVAKANKYVPDIIISDVAMPKMDGFNLTEKLKTNEITSHIPIILLTAKTDIGSKIKGLKEGADAFLNKPFHGEELIVRALNLVENRKKLTEVLNRNSGAQTNHDDLEISPIDQLFMQKIDLYIETQIKNADLNVEELAKQVHMSRSQLFRKMKGLVGVSPSDYIRDFRLIRGKELLLNKSGNITEVSEMIGFNSEKYFSKRFKIKFGISPSELI